MIDRVTPRSIALVGDESLVVNCALAAREAGVQVPILATSSAAVRAMADATGVTVVDRAELAGRLRVTPVDALFSIANERILPDEVLELVPAAINFHDGPLPDRAGLGVTTWAIHDGEVEHGITWHRMTAAVDEGEVIAEERFPIAADDTALSLNASCYAAALRTFPEVLEIVLEGRVTPRPGTTPLRWHGRHDRPVVWVSPSADRSDLARGARSLALGGRIRNRFGLPRLVIPRELGLLVGSVDADPAVPLGLAIGDLTDLDGTPVGSDTAARHDLALAVSAASSFAAEFAVLDPELARHESFWSERLAGCVPAVPAQFVGDVDGNDRSWGRVEVGPLGATAVEAAAVALLWWWRSTDQATVWFEAATPETRAVVDAFAPMLRAPIATVDLAAGQRTWDAWLAALEADLAIVGPRGALLRDLVARDPSLRGRPGPALRIELDADLDVDPPSSIATGDVCVIVRCDATGMVIVDHRRDVVGAASAASMAAQLSSMRDADRSVPIDRWALVAHDDRRLLDALNDTGVVVDGDDTVDALFEAAAERWPHLPAVSGPTGTLSYAELLRSARGFAHRLAEAGVVRGDLVGIAMPRDTDLVVSVLGVLLAGAAYVPLDPEYPVDRLRFMIDDARVRVVVAPDDVAALLGDGLVVVRPSDTSAGDGSGSVAAPLRAHRGDDLAYVIYTSGSTGRPKGVMLEHRNVVNFFVAMDAVVEPPSRERPGVWLSVTSLSFDISVLELLWTVARGFHVVVQGAAPEPAIDIVAKPVSMSLFFFAAGEAQASDGYRLLRESAQVADRHGFEAIWVPERHFHAFGGAYPNPSVIAAGLATITTRVQLRAGSVVLPLHASARVAEEWAVVDNLSGGRVGISFAPGWQPNDFVLNPGGFATARADLGDRIAEVQRLWRGESVDMIGPDGSTVAVRTLPRPVQPELPVWLTSAGTRATFERAGTLGTNLLTHLLGQSLEQLADNIEVYRNAWRHAGHPGEGHVTLMLHTYLDADAETARSRALEPMKAYLRTATGLIKNLASAFPTFANAGKDADEAFRSLTDDELDQLLTMAAHRYVDASGLFGTDRDAADMVRRCAALGVDEVACLIDFGVDTEAVLGSLDHLVRAREMVAADVAGSAASGAPTDAGKGVAIRESVASLVARHDVTHLQCTPSLAAMLLIDPDDRVALTGLRHLMVGGEAMPERLAAELRDVVTGRITNMYGPTETTIWSLVHEIERVDGAVPIGRPIANTTVHVLTASGAEVPVGVLGELHLGGAGVARGYLGRPELTAERFVVRGRTEPGDEWGRVYATGDLARIRRDGVVEFAGRVDHQVKVRGHRIELGEIEALLDTHPTVERAVVVARGDAAAARLVAYVVASSGARPEPDELRSFVAGSLPSIMVPDRVVALDAFPLTPNGKVDRARLPDTDIAASAPVPVAERAAGASEALVAEVWAVHLQRDAVGRNENFFDIGGHSLSAVAVFRDLQRRTGAAITLTDVFRHPTVASFAAHLDRQASGSDRSPGPDESGTVGTNAIDRGALRRQARSGRSTSTR
jgi:natural product biosynthesis luciferase-like monooxygenase protein